MQVVISCMQSHLHLQDMLALKDKMKPAEYERFTNEGFFTIRSNKFWSKVRTNMDAYYASHMDEASHMMFWTKWTLGMVYLHNVCDEIGSFCAVSITTTDKHVDMRQSRVTRDTAGLGKLNNWLLQHNLASLPSTRDAAKQHFLRTYH